MICNKCQIDKELNQYYTYFHSTQNKFRTRKLCKSCFNHQKLIYRESIKNKKIIEPDHLKIDLTPIPQPSYIPTPEPLVKTDILIDMDTKVCFTCKVEKPITDFYIHKKTNRAFTRCKQCELKIDKDRYEQQLEDNGGSERTKSKPGQWSDRFQQENVEGFLKVLGWEHNGKHWWKEGVRGDDGVWEKMRGMKRYRAPLRTPKKSPVLERLMVHIEDIIKLRKEGMTFSKLSYIYKTSSPYITKVIMKYYESQEDSRT
jgi:hypothetical protein